MVDPRMVQSLLLGAWIHVYAHSVVGQNVKAASGYRPPLTLLCLHLSFTAAVGCSDGKQRVRGVLCPGMHGNSTSDARQSFPQV